MKTKLIAPVIVLIALIATLNLVFEVDNSTLNPVSDDVTLAVPLGDYFIK